ncbi:hypothetical protein SCA6_016897 [Theobroma cacao]
MFAAVKPNRRLLVFSVFIRKPSTLSSLLEHQADPIVAGLLSGFSSQMSVKLREKIFQIQNIGGLVQFYV